MGIKFGSDSSKEEADEYEKLVENICDRLHNAGFTGVDAIMGHVEQSLKHWGIDWMLREKFGHKLSKDFGKRLNK